MQFVENFAALKEYSEPSTGINILSNLHMLTSFKLKKIKAVKYYKTAFEIKLFIKCRIITLTFNRISHLY